MKDEIANILQDLAVDAQNNDRSEIPNLTFRAYVKIQQAYLDSLEIWFKAHSNLDKTFQTDDLIKYLKK